MLSQHGPKEEKHVEVTHSEAPKDRKPQITETEELTIDDQSLAQIRGSGRPQTLVQMKKRATTV